MASTDSQTPGPLSGVRIADFTDVVMGPLATQMLADMGADVVRVEAPGGDVIRQYEPMRSPAMSAFSMNLNRNKRSIVLDLKSELGAAAARDLISGSDVFVTNMRRSAVERLGLGVDEVRLLRPDIVYCIANGFGSNGPHADRAAYDDVMQAASGLASMFAWNGGDPRLVPSIYADKVTGVHIAFAIAAALHGRALDGRGVTIEVPMAETLAAFNLVEHLGGQTFEPPFGGFSYQRIRTPNRRPRRTADGWIVLLPYSGRNWQDFFAFGQQPELADDPRFATTGSRVDNADALYGLMDDIVAARSTAEWVAYCDERSIPCSEVVELSEIGDDPHFEAVGLLVEDHHPTEGPYRRVRSPILADGETAALRHHAPRLGADTAEVLNELGWTQAQISAVVAESKGR